MTIFEINGSEVTGGKNDSDNKILLNRVNTLEGYIQAIGKTIGMASLEGVFVRTERDGYGFRFASTSAENYDVRGIQSGKNLSPGELAEKLGLTIDFNPNYQP